MDSNNSDEASEKTMLDIYLKEKASEASMRRSVFQAARELDLAYGALRKSQASHKSSVSKHAKLQTELQMQGVKVRVLHDAWKKATKNNQGDDNGAGGGVENVASVTGNDVDDGDFVGSNAKTGDDNGAAGGGENVASVTCDGDLVGSNAKTGETTINNAKTRILDQFDDDNIDDDQLLYALAETEKLMLTKHKAEKEKLISTKQSSTGGKDVSTKPSNDQKETATKCPKVPTLASTASTKGHEVVPTLNPEFQESSVIPSNDQRETATKCPEVPTLTSTESTKRPEVLPNVVSPPRGSSSTRGRKTKTAPESPSVVIAEPPTLVLPPKAKKTKVVH